MPMRAATLSITSPGPIIQVTVSPPVPGSELLLGGDPPTSFTIMDGDPEDGVFELDLTDVLPMDVDDVYILYLLETQSQDAIPFLTASATEPVTQTPLAYVGAPLPAWYTKTPESLPVCCIEGPAHSFCVFHRKGAFA